MRKINIRLVAALFLAYGISFVWIGINWGKLGSIIFGVVCLAGSIGTFMKKSWSRFPVYIISVTSILVIDLVAMAFVATRIWPTIPIGIEMKWRWLYGNNIGKAGAFIALILFNVIWIACSLSIQNYFERET